MSDELLHHKHGWCSVYEGQECLPGCPGDDCKREIKPEVMVSGLDMTAAALSELQRYRDREPLVQKAVAAGLIGFVTRRTET